MGKWRRQYEAKCREAGDIRFDYADLHSRLSSERQLHKAQLDVLHGEIDELRASDHRVIVTGSRNWTDRSAVISGLRCEFNFAQLAGKRLVVVHGACPTGADKFADDWYLSLVPCGGYAFRTLQRYDLSIERFPANWNLHGKAAGPLRNQQMVDAGADLVLAFPLGDSRGTRHCISVAVRAGIPVYLVEGDSGPKPAKMSAKLYSPDYKQILFTSVADTLDDVETFFLASGCDWLPVVVDFGRDWRQRWSGRVTRESHQAVSCSWDGEWLKEMLTWPAVNEGWPWEGSNGVLA